MTRYDVLRLVVNSPFHSSSKVTKPLHETEVKIDLVQLGKWKQFYKKETYQRIYCFHFSNCGQPSPRFHVEAWLPFSTGKWTIPVAEAWPENW